MEGTSDAHWWEYDQLESGEPYDWEPAARGDSPYDNLDFHLDLGCGRKKKGRLGIDRFYSPAVDLAFDLERLTYVPCKHDATPEVEAVARRGYRLYQDDRGGGYGVHRLPFPDASTESIVSHHCLEHIGEGFIRLMDECHRILKPGGVFRIITPLFPSTTAVEDPDHKRYFMENSFDVFCGSLTGEHEHDEFSQPYTTCRFEMIDKDISPRPGKIEEFWTPADRREIRVALRKHRMV